MEDRERQRQLKDERYREWQTRRRDPGDLATWAVVLGGLLAVLLFLCAAYVGHALLGIGVLVLIAAWLIAVWVVAKVNVPSVLWGRMAGVDIAPDRERIVLGASALLALVAIGFLILDVVSSLDFGWYGLVTGAVGALYLALVGWSRLRGDN